MCKDQGEKQPGMAAEAWNLGTQETDRNTLASSRPALATHHVSLREGRVRKSGEERGGQGRRGKKTRGEPRVFPSPVQNDQKPQR